MDREQVSVAEPVTQRPTPKNKKKPRRQPRYNVILWDDNEHTVAYVTRMLMELFAKTREQGVMLAKEVDSTGRAILLTTTKEHAELKQEQIHAYGKDDEVKGCLGSMWATIEPMPGD